MAREQLLYIISLDENQSVEFNASFSKEVIEFVVTFSNTRGEMIMLGCNDKKEIVGIDISRENISQWINEIKQNTELVIFLNIDVKTIDNKAVAGMCVSGFPLKPVAYKDRYFDHHQNSNHFIERIELDESGH